MKYLTVVKKTEEERRNMRRMRGKYNESKRKKHRENGKQGVKRQLNIIIYTLLFK